MFRVAKLIVIGFLIFTFFQSAYAIDLRIKNYSQLAQMLESGFNIHVVTDFSKCTAGAANANLQTNSIGGFNFNQFLKYQVKGQDGYIKEVIATSTTMLVRHPSFGHVYNYVRLRLFTDNSAEIISETLDPKNFTMLSQSIFHCAISNGEEKSGVSLFAKNS